MLIIFILGWVICSVFSYGFLFAYVQGRFARIAKEDYTKDMIAALTVSLFGPFALFSVAVTRCWEYGLKFR